MRKPCSCKAFPLTKRFNPAILRLKKGWKNIKEALNQLSLLRDEGLRTERGMSMGNRIITISREFGSGGRTIGRMAAEKLGIPCYDQELIEKIAEETGMLKSYVESNVEDVQGGWLSVLAGRDYYGHSPQDDLHAAQTKVIRELADKSSCVIIGRCADSILEDYDVLKVFIHASMEKRAERIVNQYGETAEDPIQRLKDKDKKRKAYYQLYSDRKWGAMENYHVALDSGVLGVERCAEIISQLY